MNLVIFNTIGWSFVFCVFILFKSIGNKRKQFKYMTVTKTLRKIKRFKKGFNDSCDIKLKR